MIFMMLAAVFLTAAGSASAQPTNRQPVEKVLVESNPPLTQSRVDELIEYFEWSLNARLSGKQRSRIQQIVVAEWRGMKNDAALNFAALFDKARRFKALAPERRAEVQPRQQRSFLEFISREPRSELDQILYDAAQQARQSERRENTADDSPQERRTNAGTGANLIGEWSTGSQAFSLFGSSAGDVFANAGGSLRSFKIYPDGRVEFAAFFTQSLAGCVTKILRTSDGKMSLSGDRITFDFAPGAVRSQSGCDRSRNYTKTVEAERRTYVYTLEPFNDGQKLCLLDAGNASYCLYKK